MNSPKQQRQQQGPPSPLSPLRDRNARPFKKEGRKVWFSENENDDQCRRLEKKCAQLEKDIRRCKEDHSEKIDLMTEYCNKKEDYLRQLINVLESEATALRVENADLQKKLEEKISMNNLILKEENEYLRGKNIILEGKVKTTQRKVRDLKASITLLQVDSQAKSEKLSKKIQDVKEKFSTKVETLRDERERIISHSESKEREFTDKIFKITKESRSTLFEQELRFANIVAVHKAEKARLERDFQSSQARIARMHIEVKVARKQRDKVRFVSRSNTKSNSSSPSKFTLSPPSKFTISPPKNGNNNNTQTSLNVDGTKPFVFTFNPTLTTTSTQLNTTHITQITHLTQTSFSQRLESIQSDSNENQTSSTNSNSSLTQTQTKSTKEVNSSTIEATSNRSQLSSCVSNEDTTQQTILTSEQTLSTNSNTTQTTRSSSEQTLSYLSNETTEESSNITTSETESSSLDVDTVKLEEVFEPRVDNTEVAEFSFLSETEQEEIPADALTLIKNLTQKVNKLEVEVFKQKTVQKGDLEQIEQL